MSFSSSAVPNVINVNENEVNTTSSLALAIINPAQTTVLTVSAKADNARAIPTLPTDLTELIALAQGFHVRGREYRRVFGLVLLNIHQLLAKSGHGTFMRTLTEIGVKYSTARDYMVEARHYYFPDEAVQTAEVPDYAPSGDPDPVALAIVQARAQVQKAQAREENPLTPPAVINDNAGRFNWSFRGLPQQMCEELKTAKEKLGRNAVLLLIEASRLSPEEFALYLDMISIDAAKTKEVNDEQLAA